MYTIPELSDQQTNTNLFLAPIKIRSRGDNTGQQPMMCPQIVSLPKLHASIQKFQKLPKKSHTIFFACQNRTFSLDNILVQLSFATASRNFEVFIYFSFIGQASPLSPRAHAFSPLSLWKRFLAIRLIFLKMVRIFIMPLDLKDPTWPHRHIDLTNHRIKFVAILPIILGARCKQLSLRHAVSQFLREHSFTFVSSASRNCIWKPHFWELKQIVFHSRLCTQPPAQSS